MTLAALLARYGIASLVIEADDGYCAGSRAICMSRRSQEILGWVGADRPLVDKGLSWVGGRSYFRDREVLHFQMPSEPTQRYAPMVNIQQYYAEEYAHKAALAQGPFALQLGLGLDRKTGPRNGGEAGLGDRLARQFANAVGILLDSL